MSNTISLNNQSITARVFFGRELSNAIRKKDMKTAHTLFKDGKGIFIERCFSSVKKRDKYIQNLSVYNYWEDCYPLKETEKTPGWTKKSGKKLDIDSPYCKEEIQNLLRGTKIITNGKNVKIQQKLFAYGFKWASQVNNGSNEIIPTETQFLFIESFLCANEEIPGIIFCSNNPQVFNDSIKRRVSPTFILRLK